MRIGFIGAGNMGGALVHGMVSSGVSPEQLVVYDINMAACERFVAMGVCAADSPARLVEMADVVTLAVKPKYCAQVLEQIAPLMQGKYLLSIALGWTQAMLAEALPLARGIVRIMPNTPAQVGQGVIPFNANHTLDMAAFDELKEMLSGCGRTFIVEEQLFDAVTAISGSGPAYVYMFMEAMADAGVRQGLPRDLAYQLCAQTLAGAAEMVLATGEHPGQLKDKVSSPAGSTIEAVYALEKAGLRAAVMDAVDACARKAAEVTAKSAK